MYSLPYAGYLAVGYYEVRDNETDGKLGAINFNNMLPVTKNNIIKLDLDKECLTKSEEKYSKLLKEQIYWLNRNDEKLYGRSKKLYDKGKLKNKSHNLISKI